MAEVERKRVVWILGAGFSVPLGGPLFRKLISPETLRVLKAWEQYADQDQRLRGRTGKGAIEVSVPVEELSEIVCQLYESGVGGPLEAMQLWSDAEQFLDRVELATHEPDEMLATDIQARLRMLQANRQADTPAFKALEILRGLRGLEILHTEAIRFVAGACSAFLRRAEQSPKIVDESEQWDPYRRWYSCLQEGADAALTFNYDRGLDILGAHGSRLNSKSAFVSPVEYDPKVFAGFAARAVPVYHLHGHVGWVRGPNGQIQIQQPDLKGIWHHPAIAHAEPGRAVIGVPGQLKLTLPRGLLKHMWDGAREAIEEAHAVVFVGYRFPETDNLAKRWIIDALKKNPEATVHVVLGANNPDMPRLRGMLEWTRPREQVRVHEMLSQDFFAVFERSGLFRP